VKIKQGCLEDYKKYASTWQALIHKYGGRVLGFYYDKEKEEVIGIAEYESVEFLKELQENGEADVVFPSIKDQFNKAAISMEEQILEKLNI